VQVLFLAPFSVFFWRFLLFLVFSLLVYSGVQQLIHQLIVLSENWVSKILCTLGSAGLVHMLCTHPTT
jgi:hypothetical protein